MSLIIPAGTATPAINLDPSLPSQIFKGISIPIDAVKFYQPVLQYIEENHSSFNRNVIFSFDFEYYNTSSSKVILNLLRTILELKEKHQYDWNIQWLYNDEDDFMFDAGTDIEALLLISVLTPKPQTA